MRQITTSLTIEKVGLVFESIEYRSSDLWKFASFLESSPGEFFDRYSRVRESKRKISRLLRYVHHVDLHNNVFNFAKLSRNHELLERAIKIEYHGEVGNRKFVEVIRRFNTQKIQRLLFQFVFLKIPKSMKQDRWLPSVLRYLDCQDVIPIAQKFWFCLSYRDYRMIFGMNRLRGTCKIPEVVFSPMEDLDETSLIALKLLNVIPRRQKYSFYAKMLRFLDNLNDPPLLKYHERALRLVGQERKQKRMIKKTIRGVEKLIPIKEGDMLWGVKVIHVLMDCLCLYAKLGINVSKYWSEFYHKYGELMMPMDVTRLIKLLSIKSKWDELRLPDPEYLPIRMRPTEMKLRQWRKKIPDFGRRGLTKAFINSGQTQFNKISDYLVTNFLLFPQVYPAVQLVYPDFSPFTQLTCRLNDFIKTTIRVLYKEHFVLQKIKGKLCINSLIGIDPFPLIVHSLKVLMYEGLRIDLSILPDPHVDLDDIKALRKNLKSKICKVLNKKFIQEKAEHFATSALLAFRGERKLLSKFSWREIYRLIHDPQ